MILSVADTAVVSVTRRTSAQIVDRMSRGTEMDLTRRWGRKTFDDCVAVGMSEVKQSILVSDWLRLSLSRCEYEMDDSIKTTIRE